MPTSLSSSLVVHLFFEPITYHFCMAMRGHAWLHLAHSMLMPISCPFLPIHIHTHVNEAPCKCHELPSHDVFKHVTSLLLPLRRWNEVPHGDLCVAKCTLAAGCCFNGEMGLRWWPSTKDIRKFK